MEKYRRLKRSEDFRRVMSAGRGWSDHRLVIKKGAGGEACSRVGIVASKKVGGAVVRNLIRRRLKEIMRQLAICPGYDIVVIARQVARKASYEELAQSVHKLTGRAGLVIKDEKSGSLADKAVSK